MDGIAPAACHPTQGHIDRAGRDQKGERIARNATGSETSAVVNDDIGGDVDAGHARHVATQHRRKTKHPSSGSLKGFVPTAEGFEARVKTLPSPSDALDVPQLKIDACFLCSGY